MNKQAWFREPKQKCKGEGGNIYCGCKYCDWAEQEQERENKINLDNEEVAKLEDGSYEKTIRILDAKLITDRIVKTLNPKEKLILEMRYGFIDGRCYTLEEVGERFGVTRERVRQIDARTIEKIKTDYKDILKTLTNN